MRLLLISLLLLVPVHAQEYAGTGAYFGKGVNVGVPFSMPPPGGLVFSPPTCSSACNVSITYTPATHNSIFYAVNAQAYPASTLYSSPVAIPGSATTTLSAIVVPTSAGGGIVQSMQNQTGTGSSTANWSSVVATGCPLTFNAPGMKHGGGTTGCPSNLAFITHQTAPSFDGQTLHYNMTAATSGNTQVLYAGDGNWPAPSATFIAQDFYILQGFNATTYKSYESEHDAELYDRTLQLTTAFECDQQSSKWRYNGQGGSWQDFSPEITQDCPYPFGVLATGANPSQTTITFPFSADAGATISIGACDPTPCENVLTTTSGTSPTVKRAQNSTTAQTWIAGTLAREWVHVQTLGIFNPGVTQSACISFSTGKATECVYFGYIIINGTLYGSTQYGGTQWGTTNVKNASGQTIAVPALSRPAEPGYAGVERCFNQFQLYSEHAGTVDMYLDLDNVTCGYGQQLAGANPRYVVP